MISLPCTHLFPIHQLVDTGLFLPFGYSNVLWTWVFKYLIPSSTVPLGVAFGFLSQQSLMHTYRYCHFEKQCLTHSDDYKCVLLLWLGRFLWMAQTEWQPPHVEFQLSYLTPIYLGWDKRTTFSTVECHHVTREGYASSKAGPAKPPLPAASCCVPLMWVSPPHDKKTLDATC